MKFIFTAVCFCIAVNLFAQSSSVYTNNLKTYQKKYIAGHEVVKGSNKKYFRFYSPSEKYKVKCRFEISTDTATVIMKTSGKTIPEKDFMRYGKLLFTVNDTTLTLNVYRSKSLQNNPQYGRYLFIPFTDATTGNETYGSGRYIDIMTTDIKNNAIEIDFNKAYNPYCAYSNDYNCPIPPRENFLTVAIKAGEKNFAKGH